MKEWLYPGAKVVCVADAATIASAASFYGCRCPHHGGIYTVREVRSDRALRGSDLVLLLEEIDNRHLIGRRYPNNTKCYLEPGYNVRGFRPLTKRPTDISVFTDLLHDVKRAEPVMLNTPWGKVEA